MRTSNSSGDHFEVAIRAALATLVVFTASTAHAQCGATLSSCRQCHEIDANGPPPPAARWHSDHALGDFCADCHGGDRTAPDEASAHAGLVDPLSPSGERCVACHAGEPSKLGAYAPETKPKNTSAAAAPPAARKPPSNGSSGGAARPANATLAALAILLALGGGAYVLRNEARRRSRRLPSVRAVLERREWSPYACGALLGVLAATSMALFGHRLSGGGAYQQLAAPAGRALMKDSVYFHRVLAGAARWELMGLLGALAGAFSAARLGGAFRVRTMPDAEWTSAFGGSTKKRWLVGFFGAALTEIASGIAGGCTASLAISGGAALAPGAFAFMGAMFLGGVPTAWLVFRRGHR
ncbi:MAG TPA: YeeE/YedE thiosulfate transporter family protein [Polyangiaceae bacterium]|nr:YeeE/YedE thiosulfate transporter family protein [Polyangiaceae bacterium]